MANLNLNSGLIRSKWTAGGVVVAPPQINAIVYTPPDFRDISAPIYRNLEECYIDKFLETGLLRLCNFESCANLEDLNRKDEHEGFGTISVSDGVTTIEMCLSVGMNPLMLCCTEDTSSYRACNSYIKINDPEGLCNAITDALVRKGRQVNGVVCAPCSYSERLIIHDVPAGLKAYDNILHLSSPGRGEFDYNLIDEFVRVFAGKQLYLRKPVRCKKEREIRMLWDCNRLTADRYEEVCVPRPERFCEKIML